MNDIDDKKRFWDQMRLSFFIIALAVVIVAATVIFIVPTYLRSSSGSLTDILTLPKGNTQMSPLVAIFLLIILFFVLREILTWYWKINRIVSLLERIERNTQPAPAVYADVPPSESALK